MNLIAMTFQNVENKCKRPVAATISRVPMAGANALTMLGLGLCILASILLVCQPWVWIAAIVFFIGCTADFFDGELARIRPQGHDFKRGGYLDTNSDKWSEFSILVAFDIVLSDHLIMTLVTVSLGTSLLVSLAKAAAADKDIRLSWPEVQVLGHAGRVLILCAGLALASVFTLETAMIYTLVALIAFNVFCLVERYCRVFVEDPVRQLVNALRRLLRQLASVLLPRRPPSTASPENAPEGMVDAVN